MDTTAFLQQNWTLLLPLVLLQFGLSAAAIIDLLRRQPDEVRGGNKLPWIIVALLGIIGAIVYFIIGRKDSDHERD